MYDLLLEMVIKSVGLILICQNERTPAVWTHLFDKLEGPRDHTKEDDQDRSQKGKPDGEDQHTRGEGK